MKLLIIGATGLVGERLIKLINDSDLTIDKISFVTSKRSANKEILFRNNFYTTVEFNEVDLNLYNIACITTNELVSKKIVPILKKYNYKIIDNSSAYRKTEYLTIPEINYIDNLDFYVNPNCCVIQCIIPLYNINKEFKIKRIIYNTYQSLSGGGRELLNLSLNKCIPVIGEFKNKGDTSEEEKLIFETKTILNLNIPVIANCVRVPVSYGHLVNIIIEVENDDSDKILNLIKNSTTYLNDLVGVNLDNDSNIYTTRFKKIDVNTYSFYTYANNILRGSSFNTLGILLHVLNKSHN